MCEFYFLYIKSLASPNAITRHDGSNIMRGMRLSIFFFMSANNFQQRFTLLLERHIGNTTFKNTANIIVGYCGVAEWPSGLSARSGVTWKLLVVTCDSQVRILPAALAL